MDNINSFNPTHPGEVLKEELQFRHISQKYFAKLINVPYTMLNEILNCKRPVTTDIALLLEAAIGISADLLVNMQSRYNLQIARKDTENKKRLENIHRACLTLFQTQL